ncbi:MAG: hypothetical protein QOD26_575 [Betaproteobacteria bacterium]|jgi:uncharacterized protein YjbJ (UPF0337 family)|nr:hypothetical protein [Betaproteobacteria bacterium]
MNWDSIEGNWSQFKGTVKQHWGKLSDDQLDTISGKRHLLAGQIQQTYAVSMENAEKQVATWQQAQKETTLEDKPAESKPIENNK